MELSELFYNIVSVPIRGLFNLTQTDNIIELAQEFSCFRPH